VNVTPARRRRPLQVFRIASLLLPSAVAWEVATMALHRTQLDEAVARALGPLWLATLGALIARGVDTHVRRRALPPGVSWSDALEVLTASGSSLAWTGAAAVIASVWIGWASLSLVGLFGLCALHLVALWTLLRTGGHDPWRRASLSRRFVPGSAVEGETVIEELRLVAPRIPAGFRLFARGRIGPRWPVSRYAVQAGDSGAEVVLERDVGPALRGTYDAEPLEVWLQDVLGLCRSPCVAAGAAQLTVLPRPPGVDGARHLLEAGGYAEEPRTALRLPTSGSFRLREYAPGDDVRRIHWLRSVAAQQIVVRLPDELPPDQPAVRLVLDTFHAGLASATDPLSCRAPDELLDNLVRVWVGVGRALLERGVRVTMVTAVSTGGEIEPVRRPLHRRALAQAEGLGARAAWQRALRPVDLLTDEPSIVVSHRLPLDDVESVARWVVVPGVLWTAPPEPDRSGATLLLAHPPGSADNRPSRRALVRSLRRQERADHEAFRVLVAHSPARHAGNLLARPVGPGRVLLEVLQ
jgi:uncharacterized protein (DUF58 family)